MPRTASSPLVSALAGPSALFRADLLTFTLLSGTIYRWTSWDVNLTANSNLFTASRPWVSRGKWNLTNRMAVPSLDVKIVADNTAFSGGANIKTQIHNGLFDGATCLLQYAFMETPGNTSALGTVDIFSGVAGKATIEGAIAKITVKGKVNLLDQYAPRNVYQVTCNHAFCDAGCTLSRASFTASYTVGSSPAPTNVFVPWTSAPSNPQKYAAGTLTMTSGAAAGQARTIASADSTGLTLTYPFYQTPAPGDSFTAFQGCDKSFNNAGSVQSCTAYANTANYQGYPYIPPPGSQF